MRLMRPIFAVGLFFLCTAIFAQEDFDKNIDNDRLRIIHYGTETEIIALIQSLRAESSKNATSQTEPYTDAIDGELVALADNTKNQKILSGIVSFFGDKGKEGLENQTLAIIERRNDGAKDTVLAAINYFWKIKSPNAVSLLEEIIDDGVSDFTGPAIRALGNAAGGAGGGTADEVADYLIDLYTNRDPGTGNNSILITALGSTGSAKAIPFLTSIVKDSGEVTSLRIAAVEALGKLSDGLDAILGALTTAEPSLRTAIVGVLGNFSGQAVDDAIIENFRDSFFRTRAAAAKAAGERKLTAAIPYLKYRAEKDEALIVKETSIRALGAIGNTEAVAVLENLFSEPKNPDKVRILSAETLVKNNGDYVEQVVTALDEAQKGHKNALYNGFLRLLSTATSKKLETLAVRFFASNSALEKSCALDIVLNNKFSSLTGDVQNLTDKKNGNLAKKAQKVLENL